MQNANAKKNSHEFRKIQSYFYKFMCICLYQAKSLFKKRMGTPQVPEYLSTDRYNEGKLTD